MIFQIFMRSDAELFPPEEQWQVLALHEVRGVFILADMTEDLAELIVKQINHAVQNGAPWSQYKKKDGGQ